MFLNKVSSGILLITCYGSVMEKDGAGNQSRARCAGSAVDWVLAKTKNYYIAGLIPLFPTLRSSRIILLPANAALKPYAQHHF